MLSIFALLVSTIGLAQTNPSKAPKARNLTVAIKQLEPFVMKRGAGFEGFSIDLWQEIAANNGWKFQYTYLPTVKAVLDAVQNGQADVGIAGISMTDEREQALDFSYPMFNAGLQIMVPERTSINWQDSLRNAFSADLLRIFGVMFGVMLIAGHIIWLVERRIEPGYPRAYFPGVGEGIWRAGMNLATGSAGERSPTTLIGRIVAFTWVLAGIVLISNLTATVTTNLTVQQIQGNISGPKDLFGKRVVTVGGTTASTYLTNLGLVFTRVERVEDAYGLLETGKADALVYDSPVLLYHATKAGNGKVRVVGPIFKREFYGIALPTASVLREPIDRSLLNFTNGGTYARIYEHWFGSEGER
jgi:polar amino acid transport system substrate-binding protein